MLRGCKIKVFSVLSILILLMVETWQALALGKDYFLELENWFELLILSLAVSTLCLKAELDSLAIVASVGICLAWIELIFQFGRYPSLGGTFSIMYYSITKRIIRTVSGTAMSVCMSNCITGPGPLSSGAGLCSGFLHYPFRQYERVF